ncbi:MAG: rhodanese-like domain-containing protein [Polyangiaceae bacterium]|nr:rhodanese-like domain-containing protein [Polyangiaceae bacterium]
MPTVPRCSPADADKLVAEQGYTHVDVRTQAEYDAGHPAGSINVPFMLAGPGGMAQNTDFVRVMDGLFSKDSKIVLDCRSGARSLRAAELLMSHGYTQVVDQRAGFEGPRDPMGRPIEPGWKAAGLPVENMTPGGSYAEILQKIGAK